MRAEHRRPFVAFFVVAALCALALGTSPQGEPVPSPIARTPDREIVPRAASAPVGFELLGETAAQLLVKRIRSAAAVDLPAAPGGAAAATTALAGVGVDSTVAAGPARVRTSRDGSSRSSQTGVRRPAPQASPAPTRTQTVERSLQPPAPAPQPAPQPAHQPEATQRSGSTDRSGTAGRPAHAGQGRTAHRTTARTTTHTKARGKTSGKTSGKAHARRPGRGKGRR